MACYTLDEIADKEGLTHQAISLTLQESSDLKKLAKSDLALAEHAVDFEVPIYNIWKQQEKSKGPEHFGNSECLWSGHPPPTPFQMRKNFTARAFCQRRRNFLLPPIPPAPSRNRTTRTVARTAYDLMAMA